jgi:glycogenin glucosyltransferase
LSAPAAPATPPTGHVPSWGATGYSKLALWTLGAPANGGWEAVVYVDADAVVLEDLSEVFRRLSPACPLCAAPDVFPPDRFNAGVLGVWLDPGLDTYRALLAQALVLPTYDGGDTGFLNAYFNDWFVVWRL